MQTTLLRSRRCRAIAWSVVALSTCSALALASADAPASPAAVYGDLFARVQTERIFPDGKTFADATARVAPDVIMRDYASQRSRPGFDLRAFVAKHFQVPQVEAPSRTLPDGLPVEAYIDRAWSVLEHPAAKDETPYSSRLPTPERYVVPGGRFVEFYYWDSYFTMLGLEVSKRHDLTQAMVKNFASMIDQYGHVPNGNRTYYLSRSQPPFFALMVALLAERDGAAVFRTYLPQLRREYAFWMDGAEGLAPGARHRRVVRLADGSILNRYWDDRDAPRDESYREDVETARTSQRPAAETYRDIRAAAESGWDFSSRWFDDEKSLSTIRTTELVPPDLNSLLYKVELTIARGCLEIQDAPCVRDMRVRAAARKAAMTKHLWSSELGAFADYDLRTKEVRRVLTAATLYPLFVEACTPAQARTVAKTVRAKLLWPRGLVTTTTRTGQQWDAPNGWAPLQWIAVMGLRNYREQALAATIAKRWIATNLDVYQRHHVLVEKYDVAAAEAGGGGEYPVQDGFGWTNGVLRRLMSMYPEARPKPPTAQKRKGASQSQTSTL